MKWRFIISVLCAVFMFGCATTTQQGAVGVDRNQLLLISAAHMHQAANTSYAQVLKDAQQKGVLNTDAATLKRVRTISKRIVEHVGVYRDDALNWDWQINVIQDDQLNAWCMPGGKIVFYSGIIGTLQLDDAEIAAIMGHEIAHALREHGRERASEAQMKQLGLSALQSLGVKHTHLKLTDVVANVTFSLPNSRTHETEADRMGVELAARAGYDPQAAVRVWGKMRSMSQGSPPEILSTHPAHDTRIADLRVYATNVQPLYQQAQKP